jgi:hypothetical protein
MRKPAVRALFNAAGTAPRRGAASPMLHALAPTGRSQLRDAGLFGVLLASAATYYVVNRGLVSTVLALDGALPVTRSCGSGTSAGAATRSRAALALSLERARGRPASAERPGGDHVCVAPHAHRVRAHRRLSTR